MQFRVFKTTKHRGCSIYLRNFGSVFEFFCIIRHKLHAGHVVIRPSAGSLFRRLIGKQAGPYSEKELQGILGMLKKMAESTIETVLDAKK